MRSRLKFWLLLNVSTFSARELTPVAGGTSLIIVALIWFWLKVKREESKTPAKVSEMYFQQTVTMNECQQHLCPWGEFFFLSGKTRQSGLDKYLIPSKSSVWRRHFCRSVVLPAFVHGFISSVAVHLLNFLKTFYVFLGCLFFSPL